MESLKRVDWPTFWLYAALIAIGFTLALPVCFVVGLISFGKDAPAWIQAIGSVVGIFSAVGVAIWSRQMSMKDHAQREHADKIARHVRAHRALDRFLEYIDDQLNEAKKAHGDRGGYPLKRRTLPADILDLENYLHLVEEAAGDGFTAINQFELAQTFLKRDRLEPTDFDQVINSLNQASNRCSKAAIAARQFLWELGD